MAYHVELEFAARTDTGLLRPHNEDAVATNPSRGFAILADGMGGYNAGEVASQIAIATVGQALDGALQAAGHGASSQRNRRIVTDAVEQGNAAIRDAARANPLYSGMGTTIVVALFQQDRVMVAHVGDSRCYRFRQGELALLTHDHSLLQEQVDAGLIDAEQARFSPDRNLITRALGISHAVDIEIHEHAVKENDLYLLCSDGLSDMLATQEISDILNQLGADPGATCDALIAAANRNGGRDNISVILVKIQAIRTAAEGTLGRLWHWFSNGD